MNKTIVSLAAVVRLLVACAPAPRGSGSLLLTTPTSGAVVVSTQAVLGTSPAQAPTALSAPPTDSAPTATPNYKQCPAPPSMAIDPSKFYVATLKTAKGDVVIELLADKSPVTVNNFVFLARQGFYDKTTFHRVMAGQFAQGGDPSGTGTGGPGYTVPDEFSPALRFEEPGLLAMANAGPDTNGSQFF